MIDKKFFLLSFFIFILFIPELNAQLTVGVSPPSLNLGDIYPGESKIARFKVITSSGEVILTYLRSTDGRLDLFGRKGWPTLNYSEQKITSWIKFVNNPVEIEPLYGGTIEGASEVTFILKLPEDAEPGYHMGLISLDPRGPPGQQPMLNIKTVVPLIFVFNVPGKAVRSARIIDLVTSGYSDNNLNLKLYVENTGTVTIISVRSIIEIYKNEDKIATLTTGGSYLKPGEISHFDTSWSIEGIEPGVYDASITLDYGTGFVYKNSTIQVVKPRLPVAKVVEEAYVFPWWVVIALIVIIVIAYIIYKRW